VHKLHANKKQQKKFTSCVQSKNQQKDMHKSHANKKYQRTSPIRKAKNKQKDMHKLHAKNAHETPKKETTQVSCNQRNTIDMYNLCGK